MKGYRFYEEFDSSHQKRLRRGSGNVLALDIDQSRTRGNGNARPIFNSSGNMECTAAVLSTPDSPVCGTAIARAVLARNYRRITESRAREIHPAMFEFLDRFDTDGELKLDSEVA